MAGGHCSQGTKESCLLNRTIIPYWYHMSMITCKWFGCQEIVRTRALCKGLVHTVLGIPGALLLPHENNLADVVGIVGADVREHLG